LIPNTADRTPSQQPLEISANRERLRSNEFGDDMENIAEPHILGLIVVYKKGENMRIGVHADPAPLSKEPDGNIHSG
jgi:hypothetical protein